MAGTDETPSERPEDTDVVRHRPPRGRGLSRYDLLLAVVPVAFLLGLLAAGLADVPLRVALSSAGAVSALALVDGLFFNPPRRPRARNHEGPA
jgi:hypothetical protein